MYKIINGKIIEIYSMYKMLVYLCPVQFSDKHAISGVSVRLLEQVFNLFLFTRSRDLIIRNLLLKSLLINVEKNKNKIINQKILLNTNM